MPQIFYCRKFHYIENNICFVLSQITDKKMEKKKKKKEKKEKKKKKKQSSSESSSESDDQIAKRQRNISPEVKIEKYDPNYDKYANNGGPEIAHRGLDVNIKPDSSHEIRRERSPYDRFRTGRDRSRVDERDADRSQLRDDRDNARGLDSDRGRDRDKYRDDQEDRTWGKGRNYRDRGDYRDSDRRDNYRSRDRDRDRSRDYRR